MWWFHVGLAGSLAKVRTPWFSIAEVIHYSAGQSILCFGSGVNGRMLTEVQGNTIRVG